jgi:hypothetical protein
VEIGAWPSTSEFTSQRENSQSRAKLGENFHESINELPFLRRNLLDKSFSSLALSPSLLLLSGNFQT